MASLAVQVQGEASLKAVARLQWFVQLPPSLKAVKVPKALPRVMKVELLLSYHSTIAAPRLRLGISLGSAQSQLSLQTGQGKGLTRQRAREFASLASLNAEVAACQSCNHSPDGRVTPA